MHRHLPARGSALMIAMIAIAVLMVLVAGAIQFTGMNREAAASKMHGDRVEACADAARRLLLSKLTHYGVPSAPIVQVLPDRTNAANWSSMMSGHLGEGAATPTVTSVGQLWGRKRVQDLANIVGGKMNGEGFWKVVMKCGEPGSADGGWLRESEVEFVFKYGL